MQSSAILLHVFGVCVDTTYIDKGTVLCIFRSYNGSGLPVNITNAS